MLCPRCSSELADNIDFCAICGALVEAPSIPPPAATAAPQSPAPTSDAPPVVTPAEPAPPYAIFVAQVLGLALCISVLTFSAADNLGHASWHVSPIAAGMFVIAIAFLLFIPRTWRKIETRSSDTDQQKWLLKMSLVFVILFVAGATAIGATIGQSGEQSARVTADFHEFSRLGKLIADTRNATPRDIRARITMYEEIKTDVESYEAVAHKLQAELPDYDAKFPGQHATAVRSMRTIEVGLMRIDFIRQQIDVARDIALLDPATQSVWWQERMQPLIDAEAELSSGKY